MTLHEFEIKKYGGSSGIRDIGMLKSAIGRPFATFNGEDLYSDIYTKSAALIQSIANHPFVDGNKRTSFVTAAVFLRLNRYLFEVPQKEVVGYILRVVNENLSVDEISAWIKKHTKIT